MGKKFLFYDFTSKLYDSYSYICLLPLKNIFVYAFKNYGAFLVDTNNKISTRLSIKQSNILKIIGSGGTKGYLKITDNLFSII